MNLFQAIIACSVGTISVLSSLVIITRFISKVDTRVDTLADRDVERRQREHDETRERHAREDREARELTDMLDTLKTFMAVQTELNQHVSSILDSVTEKLDRVSHKTSENSAVISALTELAKRSGIQIPITLQQAESQ